MLLYGFNHGSPLVISYRNASPSNKALKPFRERTINKHLTEHQCPRWDLAFMGATKKNCVKYGNESNKNTTVRRHEQKNRGHHVQLHRKPTNQTELRTILPLERLTHPKTTCPSRRKRWSREVLSKNHRMFLGDMLIQRIFIYLTLTKLWPVILKSQWKYVRERPRTNQKIYTKGWFLTELGIDGISS